MLVVDKGWISACYQEWLTDSITVALLKPKVKAQPPKKILRRDERCQGKTNKEGQRMGSLNDQCPESPIFVLPWRLCVLA